MCRKRGRIVLVGVTGLELNRADFYEKRAELPGELLPMARAPLRSDLRDKGQDHPLGFVRWTEQRNFEGVLDLLASGQLDKAPDYPSLCVRGRPKGIPKRLTADKTCLRHAAAIQLASGAAHGAQRDTAGWRDVCRREAGDGIYSGAGNYASRMLIPAFKAAGRAASYHRYGRHQLARSMARKRASPRLRPTSLALLANPAINTVAIVYAARYPRCVSWRRCCRREKSVFVEKPLAIDAEGLGRGARRTTPRSRARVSAAHR